MAAAGVGSRRECEELIVAGRVEVDGRVASELGTKVDPSQQKIRIDGTPLSPPRMVYFAVNKPPGVVSTSRDPSGRTRVIDLLGGVRERVYTVGRLDRGSEGLILVTNDGELAQRLTHPSFGVEKTYHVLVAGTPTRDVLAQLVRGVRLAEGFAKAARVRVRGRFKQSTTLEIVLTEGRNREIRRLLARVGHKVMRLKRVAIDRVRLGDLEHGEFRPLRSDELHWLRQAGRRRERLQRRDSASSPAQGPPRPALSPTGGERLRRGATQLARRRRHRAHEVPNPIRRGGRS